MMEEALKMFGVYIFLYCMNGDKLLLLNCSFVFCFFNQTEREKMAWTGKKIKL